MNARETKETFCYKYFSTHALPYSYDINKFSSTCALAVETLISCIKRSSHRRCSVRKGVVCIFIKERLCYRCFTVNFEKFLSTPPLGDCFCIKSMTIYLLITRFLSILHFVSPSSFYDMEIPNGMTLELLQEVITDQRFKL